MMVTSSTGDDALSETRRSSRIRVSTRFTDDVLLDSPEKTRLTSTPTSSQQSTTSSHGDETPQTKSVPVNLRKRKSKTAVINPMEEAMTPLTDGERQEWKGWIELESDPALFSYILRAYGVEDVKVQEVFSLELLSDLPQPVYGLIFLFKYQDDDAEEVFGIPKCPNHIWFANQTTDNACATIALLNIVMNIPQLELGEQLDAFKEATKNLKPAYRGQRISHNAFIRTIHNSFVRKMDILNTDLALSNDYDKWVRQRQIEEKKATSKRKAINPKAKAQTKKKPQSDNEAGYHFIAYVPIKGSVWRLDGLQRQPTRIGQSGHNWMDIARDNIMQRITQYENDGIEYSLMSLCKSPLSTIKEDLARNIKTVSAVRRTLDSICPDWKAFLDGEESDIATDAYETIGLSQRQMDFALVSVSSNQVLGANTSDPTALLSLYKNLGREQAKLRVSYENELVEFHRESEVAERRKRDHTPLVYKSIKALVDDGQLKDIVIDLRGD